MTPSHAMIDPADFISDGVKAHYSAISAGDYIASRNRNNFLRYTKSDYLSMLCEMINPVWPIFRSSSHWRENSR